jgi:predicted nucleic acid-binding protein
MQIGGYARSEGLIGVTNNAREFSRMPGGEDGELGVTES